MQRLERKNDLDWLVKWKDRQIIKVVTGVRRCGKSTLFAIYQDYLRAQGVEPQQIIAINFEDLDFEDLTNYKTLYQFEKAFAECNGMTINEAMILCCLKDGEAKTAGALSEFVGLSNSRISKVINAVEGKQLIRRLINPNDKRQMLFSLTPEGRACIATMQGKDLGFDNFFTNLRKCLG